jgi:Kef-type K+ transport system membrane component KefB
MMFSSHTLIAYPLVRKLGVSSDISILTAIGGTIITDTLVLIILSVITRANGSLPVIDQLIRIIGLFGIYLVAIFYGYPRISKWFFMHVKRDRPVHFLFLILMVFISSVLAKLIGFEPIIGAFVAGMALSRSVPRNSMLMHHVDFVGNILFIPVFLIGIGMLINFRILFSEATLFITFLILISGSMLGKWLAAFITQKTMGFSPIQRNLLFGLSGSRAAAAIAVMLIGFERKLIDEKLLDATVLIILVSCLAASYLSDRYGKKMVLAGMADRDDKADDIILVPISHPSHMANLVALAIKLQDQQSPSPIYVLNIIHDDKSTMENMRRIRNSLEVDISEYNNLNESVKVITRVDLNASSGILRAAKEYMVSDIILGWGGRTTASKKIFGSIFDQLYGGSQTLYACHLNSSFDVIERTVFVLPSLLQHEISFHSIMKRMNRLPLKQGGVIEILSPDLEMPPVILTSFSRKRKIEILHHPHVAFEDLLFSGDKHTLHILFILRKQSISYSALHNSQMRGQIPAIEKGNFILVVPGFE